MEVWAGVCKFCYCTLILVKTSNFLTLGIWGIHSIEKGFCETMSWCHRFIHVWLAACPKSGLRHEWIADTTSAHHLVSRLCKILLVLDTLFARYMCLRVTQWWIFRISFLCVVQGRVLKCIELLNESANASVAFLPQSPIGVLDASACLSYKTDETKIGSCTNSSHDSPDSKRRKLNTWTDPMEWRFKGGHGVDRSSLTQIQIPCCWEEWVCISFSKPFFEKLIQSLVLGWRMIHLNISCFLWYEEKSHKLLNIRLLNSL